MNLTGKEKEILLNYVGFYGSLPDSNLTNFDQNIQNMCCILDSLYHTFGYEYVLNPEDGKVYSTAIDKIVNELSLKKEEIFTFYLNYFYDINKGFIENKELEKLSLLRSRMHYFGVTNYDDVAKSINYIKDNKDNPEEKLENYLEILRKQKKEVGLKTTKNFYDASADDIMDFLRNEKVLPVKINVKQYYMQVRGIVEKERKPERANIFDKLRPIKNVANDDKRYNLTNDEKKILICYFALYGCPLNMDYPYIMQDCIDMCFILDTFYKSFGYTYSLDEKKGKVHSIEVENIFKDLIYKKNAISEFYLSFFKLDNSNNNEFTNLVLLGRRLNAFNIRESYNRLAEVLVYINNDCMISEDTLYNKLQANKSLEEVHIKTPRDYDNTSVKDIISFLKNEGLIKIHRENSYMKYARMANIALEELRGNRLNLKK